MKKNNLTFKTLIYFAVFSVAILLILWFLQINMLDVFYEKIQINNVKRVVNQIEKKKDVSLLEDYAYKNDMCIEYLTYDETIFYNAKKTGCVLNSKNLSILNIKKDLIDDDIKFVKINDPNKGTKNLIYLVELSDNEFIFLNVLLEDLSVTKSILKHQILYLVFALILSAIIVSILISRRINKPILELTKEATKLSKGNFNVKFKKSNIKEIDQLASVLEISATEMNKTDQLRRDLLANVGHDLKTPLTMIKAYAEKVRDITYKDKKKREDDLNIIIEETDRLNNLVNDILDLSKLENTKQKLNIESYDLIENLNDIMKRYEIVENENYKFILDIPETAYVLADKHKIEQVIYNLINNAIEHTGNDLLVYITIKEKRDYFLVSIKDTGAGISDEEKNLVWKKYYKTKKAHKRNTVGTGLGLSIVKELLEIHNFEYGIDSKKNEYTTFYFKIKKNKKFHK